MIQPNASTTFAPCGPRVRRVVASAASIGPPSRRGISLVEVLLTLVVMSILAALLIPQLGQHIPDQLSAASEVVASDLEYAQSLAVANNSTYRVTFEPDENRYILRHDGLNTLLHALPSSPFRQTTDLPDQQTTDLDDLPLAHPPVRLLLAATNGGSLVAVPELVFADDGSTAPVLTPTIVWLACGESGDERFISIEINATTGLVEVGPLVKDLPADVTALLNGT